MATFEDSTNFTQHAPPPFEQQQQSSIFPQYPEMIMEAIEALNEKEGSNKSSISRQIETTYPDLPPSHTTLLSHHLNKMKESGQLLLVKNNFMKPDPNAPPKRGRGRPPKPKDPSAAAAVVSPPRPRGRPPKPRDPFAPSSSSPKEKSAAASGRQRGRPPKMAKTEAGLIPAAAAAAASPPAETKSVKRGRGRPPKVKPAVAPVAG